eukprot:CAMPEP_0175622316 /NCGR_PEP_ID=MMETSP0096-20121207/68867_1 /TAXON_ID=311494 /ORGANISM="Alexandrium monilatum, Strain CCMP3105" /LENGTH=78 /DNA_ID=CAMNT_0016927571 /DNA_START=74 /DNA_END=307 /DNA_ORIENTATION=-
MCADVSHSAGHIAIGGLAFGDVHSIKVQKCALQRAEDAPPQVVGLAYLDVLAGHAWNSVVSLVLVATGLRPRKEALHG